VDKKAGVSISIVIPVHNGGSYFRQCLSYLQKFAPPQTEIIVVADGDDRSGDVAKAFGARVLRIPKAGGPAKARNLGAAAATKEVIFFVDADVTIAEGTIEKVSRVFAENPHVEALIGSYDDAPGASNFLSQYKNLFHHYTHQTASEEASTFWGACGAIRRDVFLKLGGFDENYRLPCVEDIELGYRLKQAGYRIRLCKNIQVKHLKKWETVSLLRADFFYRALPWTDLLMRYRQFMSDLNLQWSSRASIVLIYLLIGTLALAWWWSPMGAIALVLGLALFAINFPVYRFFYNKRGMVFAIKTIPWHWFYYVYGGLAFAIGTIRHAFSSNQYQQN
jgi:GT2 family glycosyltransferase